MKVILLQDVKNVGKKGEVKEMSAGHASNFLIPKKLAILATSAEMEKLAKRQAVEETKKKEMEVKLKEVAQKIEGTVLKIEEKADENGTLYGGVDKKKVSEMLKIKGFQVEPEKINLFSHLKKIGEHEVEINILPEVKVKIKVDIKASA